MAIYILENIIFADTDPRILNMINLFFVIIMIYPAIKLGDAAEKFYRTKDPQQVVIDEVLGYWISILFIPFSLSFAVMAFIFFRIFDIVKPFPAGSLESLTGGLGIIIDDILVFTPLRLCIQQFIY